VKTPINETFTVQLPWYSKPSWGITRFVPVKIVLERETWKNKKRTTRTWKIPLSYDHDISQNVTGIGGTIGRFNFEILFCRDA
jgi:hypothetical protein